VTAPPARRQGLTQPDPERLPLQPLLDALPLDRHLARADVAGPGVISQAAVILDLSTRTLHRLRHTGLDPWKADRLAVAAGTHPYLVWGDAWITALQPRRQPPSRDPDPRHTRRSRTL